MKISRTLLFAACAGFAAPAPAANSAYDLLIVACDKTACKRIVEERLFSGLANIAEFNRSGLRLMIATLTRRHNEEDTRVSLDVHTGEDGSDSWRPAPPSAAQRSETAVVTLKRETFSPLSYFVSNGKTYQIWARLASIR